MFLPVCTCKVKVFGLISSQVLSEIMHRAFMDLGKTQEGLDNGEKARW